MAFKSTSGVSCCLIFGLVLVVVGVLVAVVVPLVILKTEKSDQCVCNGFGVYSSSYDGECNPDNGVCNCNTSANVEGDHCDVCPPGFRTRDFGGEPGKDGCPLTVTRSVVFKALSEAQTVLNNMGLDPRGQKFVATVSGLSTFALDAPPGVVSNDHVSLSVSYYEVSGDGLQDSVTPFGVLNMSAVSSDSGSEFEMFGRTFEENVKLTVDPERSTADDAVYPYLYDSRTRSLEATGLSANPSIITGLQFFSSALTQVVLLSVSHLKLSQWVDSGSVDTGFTLERNSWPRLTDSLWPAYNGMTIFARWFYVSQYRSLEDASHKWSESTLDRLLTLLQVRCSIPPTRPVALSDIETVRILVHALQVTKSPQLLWMEREGANSFLPGHAVLVYKYRNNEFTFYDPAFGREGQILVYDSSTAMFEPYYNGGFNRFYVYSHMAFQLTDTDMESVYNLTLTAFSDTDAPEIILDPFNENINANSLTVSGTVVPRSGHPMPAVLSSYLFNNDSESPAIGRGHVIVDASGHFTKVLVDVSRGSSKMVFVAGGYVQTERGIGKMRASLFLHHGYIQRDLHSSANPNLLTVSLTWDDGASDLDLHILEPGGRHIYYNRKGESGTPYLDHDNTDGFGPEHYIIEYGAKAYRGTLEGTYKIRVHYYANNLKLPESVRSIRWTVSIEGKTQERTLQITGVLQNDNPNVDDNFSSSDRSWSTTYQVNVEAVHFIAIADRKVYLTFGKFKHYHYSAQLWKNVLVLPSRHTEEKVSEITKYNSEAMKMGGVELLPRDSSVDGCRYSAWWLSKYHVNDRCWQKLRVAVSHINYDYTKESGTRYIPVFVNSDWNTVQAKWDDLILHARSYPYAEQSEIPNKFPQSVYCISIYDDVNNSNTFIRWLFGRVSIGYTEMTKSHPGRTVPVNIPDRYFQGHVFCSSDSPPPLVTGTRCRLLDIPSRIFNCTFLGVSSS